MNRKKNITNITASKAWGQMKIMLDKEMPVKNNNNKRKYGVLLLILLIGSCGIYKAIQLQEEKDQLFTQLNKKVKETDKIVQVEKNKITGSPLTKNDSETSLNKSNSTDNKTTFVKINNNQYSQPTSKANTQNRETIVNKPLSNLNRASTYNTLFNNNSKLNNTSLNDYTTKNTSNTTMQINSSHKKNSIDNKIIQLNIDTSAKSSTATDMNKSAGNNNYNTTQTNQAEAAHLSQNNSIKPIDTIDNSVEMSYKKISKNNQQNKGLLKSNSLQAGLEWNAYIPFDNKTVFMEGNAHKRPLITLIPSFWIGKKMGNKSTLNIVLNTYSQYFFTKKGFVQSNSYNVNAVSATSINNQPSAVVLSQNRQVSKVMGPEIMLQYLYFISSKWFAGLSLGCNWSNAAIVNETLTKNKTEIVKDSLYGIVNGDRDWQYIRNNFVSSKLNLGYNSTSYQMGITVNKPLTEVIRSTTQKELPINIQFFFRLKLKWLNNKTNR